MQGLTGWLNMRGVLRWLAMLPAFLPVAYGQTYRLKENAEVSRSMVQLSDLLPKTAPTELRRAGESVDVARAPQPGTARILTQEFVASELKAVSSLSRQLVIPPEIVVHRAAWPIEDLAIRDAIQRYLRRQGWELPFSHGTSLEGSKPVVAEEKVEVEVQELHWNEQQQALQVVLRCVRRQLCREFVLLLDLPASDGSVWRSHLRPTQFGADSVLANSKPKDSDQDNKEVVRGGQPAEVVWQEGGMKMSVPVICLERGRLHQTIRVSNTRTHRVFRAEVVTTHLLRAGGQNDEPITAAQVIRPPATEPLQTEAARQP